MIFFLRNKLFVMACLLMLFYLNSGCKKERTHYHISDEVKKYGLFQQYSYWIYYNEATQESDCTFVELPPVFFTENESDPMDEPLIDNVFIYLDSPILSSLRLTGNYLINVFKLHSQRISFIAGITQNSSRIIGSSTYRRVVIYDSMYVLGKCFHNVLHTSYSTLMEIGSTDSLIYEFYMVPYIGMVKIRKTFQQTDTVWSLQRYHVYK